MEGEGEEEGGKREWIESLECELADRSSTFLPENSCDKEQ